MWVKLSSRRKSEKAIAAEKLEEHVSLMHVIAIAFWRLLRRCETTRFREKRHRTGQNGLDAHDKNTSNVDR